MTDLWDPEKRTQVCASCHIGDPDPAVHRFVTHVMYAAGHPPLPAFETAAFCDGLPRHWQLMSEKTPEMQKQDYGWDPRELEQTKLAVVGEAAAFREAVNLLAKKTAGKDELDFALFDCSACHHDLKQPSWRQAAGYEGPPGRPGLRRWSPAGLELCLWYAGDTDEDRKALREEYTARMSDLRSAFTSRPYGDAALVGKAGAALVAWADGKLIPGLTRPNGGGTRYDAKGALRLLKRLAQMAADPGPGQTPDYDGARQTAWTFRAIYDDVSCALNRSPDDPETAGAAKVLDENGKAIHAQLHRLDELLNLDLPNAKGIPRDVDNDAAKKMRMAQLQAFLPCVLGHEADYDPDAVKTAFAELAKLLP